MNSLESIAKKYGTDKVQHGYIKIYEELFKNIRSKNIKLLEIGVRQGWSHLTWKEYFENGKIYGIENFESPVFKDKKHEYDFKDIQVFIGDQGDEKFLEEIPVSDLDIIIDDGGHRMSQQQISLAKLMKKLKPGGIYIIEDLHTSRKNMQDLYWDDDDSSKTTLHVLKHMQNSVYINNIDWSYISNRIKSIKFYTDDKLCIIQT